MYYIGGMKTENNKTGEEKMKALTGTKEQIERAAEIRKAILAGEGIAMSEEALRNSIHGFNGPQEVKDEHEAILDRIIAHTSARWWIANRAKTLVGLFAEAAEREGVQA